MLPSTALGIAPEFDTSVGWLNTTHCHNASFAQPTGVADAGSHIVWRLDVDSGELRRLPIGE